MIRATTGMLGAGFSLRSPHGVNGAVPAVRAPTVPGRGVSTIEPKPQSNLDKSGFRLIKKGCIVSREAVHYQVVTVRLGSMFLVRLDAFGKPVAGSALFDMPCRLFYVVSR